MYLFSCFVKLKRNIWQETISSKYYNKESIYRIIKNILSVSIPMSLCALFSASTKTIDAFTVVRILKTIIGEEKATIQYGILTGKVDTLVMLPLSFNIAFATALVPTISGLLAKNKEEIAKKRINISLLVTLLIGIPCSFIMCLFSDEVIKILFPNATMGGEMLKISSITIVFILSTQTINGALQGLGKIKIPVIAFAFGSIIKLFLNIVFIRIFKINGAIYASIVSDIVIFLICFKELKNTISIKIDIMKFLIKPLISSIIMCIIINTIYTNMKLSTLVNLKIDSLKFLISLICGLVIYIVLIIKLKVLSDDEILILPYGNQLLKRKNGKTAKSIENKVLQRN